MKHRSLRLAIAAALLGLGAAAAGATTLFGLINTGELYSSTNGGVTWSPVSTLPVRDAVALQARASVSELYLASRSGVVYKSINSGLGWTAVGAVSASDIEDLWIRHDGALLLLSATGSLYRSTDQGASFTALAALTGSNFVSLTQRTDGKLYALTRTGEVYESTDQGTTWIAKSAITVANAIRIRAIGSHLFVMTETGDIAKSTDAASSWSVVGTLSQVGMRGLVRDGANLMAASKEGHVATSADGAAWTWQGSINQLTLTALATDAPATTGVQERPLAGPLALGVPYPNPSRGGAATFPVRLESEETVVLELYDLSGRLVARRAPQVLAAGAHRLSWDPGAKAAGLYLVRLGSRSGSNAEQRWVLIQ